MAETESDIDLVLATARRFSKECLEPNAALWDEQSCFDIAALEEAGKLGFLSLDVPEGQGGLALPKQICVEIIQELSAGCVATAAFIAIQNAAGSLISKFGSVAQQEKFLPQILSGKTLASFCLTEPAAGSDSLALQTTAQPVSNGYVINGTKQFISGAGLSDLYLVFARVGDRANGISCFIVPKSDDSPSFGRLENKLGWRAQPTAQVVFEDCFVPESFRIGEEGEGLKIALSMLASGRLNIAACSLGPARLCIEKSLSYSQQRHQFGQALIENQGVQIKLAHMQLKYSAAKLSLIAAARAIDDESVEASLRCAMAKYLSTEVGYEIVDSALQLHGGYGYTKDLPFERWLRDLRAHRIVEGTSEIMELIIFRELQKLGPC